MQIANNHILNLYSDSLRLGINQLNTSPLPKANNNFAIYSDFLFGHHLNNIAIFIFPSYANSTIINLKHPIANLNANNRHFHNDLQSQLPTREQHLEYFLHDMDGIVHLLGNEVYQWGLQADAWNPDDQIEQSILVQKDMAFKEGEFYVWGAFVEFCDWELHEGLLSGRLSENQGFWGW